MNRNHYAVLLAGGAGSRLSPFSTPAFPKQFFFLPGRTRSLFQQTAWDAVKAFGEANVLTVAPTKYLSRMESELKALSPALVKNIIEEKTPNGTAGAALLAAQKAGIGSVLWLFPCDHVRGKGLDGMFPREVTKLADKEKIVVFGIPPKSPDTRFGYFLTREDGSVRQFVEKPPEPMAEAFVESGLCYWNSGITGIKAEVLIRSLKQFAPQVLKGGAVSAISIDRAVLERADNVTAFPLGDPKWMDIGTAEALHQWWRDNAPHIREWDFGAGQKVALDNLSPIG